MADKKETYIVTQHGLDKYKVGDEVELTAAQAAARINKVELKGSAKADEAAVKKPTVKEVKAQLDELEIDRKGVKKLDDLIALLPAGDD